VRQYLIYSGTFHVAAAVLMLIFFRPMLNRAVEQTVYTVDFVGAPAQAAAYSAAPAAPKPIAAQPAAAKPAPRQSREIIDSRKPAPLAPPSVLAKYHLPSASVPSEAAPQQQAESAVSEAPPSDTGGVSTDFPDFPYPWYITQVRAALWSEWSSRMPRGGAIGATVRFKITRNGAVESLSIEKPSGNKLFDFAALASVEQAAPFPPLPRDYKQAALTAHVEFRTAQ